MKNNGLCLFGKYHNILYVAAKLCFIWNLEDTEVISTLLTRIYECENTFEKFFECAIFGTKVTQLISGWRSDYKTHNENLKASVYFLKHAIKGKLMFKRENKIYNFVDIPMNCYENLSPLKTAVKAEKWDLVVLLIKYGAIAYLPFFDDDYEKYSIFKLFIKKLQIYDTDSYYYKNKINIVESLKIFIRSIPIISAIWTKENDDEENTLPNLSHFLATFGINNVDEPRTLKHLSRCAVRNYLAKNHQLPADTSYLMIPKVLIRYLNLEID